MTSTDKTPSKPSQNSKSSSSQGFTHGMFRRFASAASSHLGSPSAFFIALVIIAIWGLTGPMFHYSDTWQLIINTGTTIITFLMVFLIQSTQNRDAKAIHLKLDELIHAVKGARNHLVDLENCTDEELDELQKEFSDLRVRYTHQIELVDDKGEVKKVLQQTKKVVHHKARSKKETSQA
ncbi:MAG: low affinity iron permease family protein [Methylotenera sp.]|nr:low affinity iron permease family protein [Oligoflexia bacterium]